MLNTTLEILAKHIKYRNKIQILKLMYIKKFFYTFNILNALISK
jgi:hypothetical protein